MTDGEDELAERLLRCESNSPDRPSAVGNHRQLCSRPMLLGQQRVNAYVKSGSVAARNALKPRRSGNGER